jgi:hypothetical protein
MSTLVELVDERFALPGEDVEYQQVREWWDELFPRELAASETGWETFSAYLAGALGKPETPGLEFRPGGWTLKIRGPGVTTAITGALLAGALAIAGVAVVPAVVLPALLPLVFQLDHVDITKGDEYILAQLRLRPEVRNGRLSVDQISALLPPDLGQHLAKPDLLDFLERCRRAGLADRDGGGIRLYDPARARFRITIL